MIDQARSLTLACVVVTALLAPACKSVPLKPSTVSKSKVALTASADVNPDVSSKPSPVVVRVYQLKGDAAFSGADFFGREEYVLTPAERRTVELVVPKTAKFVGVVAAFRDIRNSQWRVVVPAPLKDDVTLSVERARVQLAPTK
jgi:type VI secretion system protein VasD